MTLRILLAEDEAQLARVYQAAMQHQGYEVTHVEDGHQAMVAAKSGAYDIMIFDIMMPVMTGLEALREIRAWGDKTYTIMLTAMSEVDDKVTGLEAGADDYLTKPISLKELLARLASVARRLGSYDEKQLTLGGVTLNLLQQELVASNSIRLAAKEAQMLAFFMHNPNKGLSTAQLYQHVWGGDEDDSDEEDVWIYVSYLRQKLRAVGANLTIEGEAGGYFTLVERCDAHV